MLTQEMDSEPGLGLQRDEHDAGGPIQNIDSIRATPVVLLRCSRESAGPRRRGERVMLR